jgi:hypothetical protein
MRLRFNVEDKGNFYEVISVNQNESDYDSYDLNTIYETYSWEIYELIASNLLNGKSVKIPKNLNRALDTTDIIITDVDALAAVKNITILKIKDIIYSNVINKAVLGELYEYSLLNNWFNEKGIYITEENKDNKYKEIIEMTSKMKDNVVANEYIDNLNAIFNIKNHLAIAYKSYKEMNSYIAKINLAKTNKEVDNIYNSFLSEYK